MQGSPLRPDGNSAKAAWWPCRGRWRTGFYRTGTFSSWASSTRRMIRSKVVKWIDHPAMKKKGNRSEELFSLVSGWMLIAAGTVAFAAFRIWDLLG